jgi:three-Cys-motif partner protein
MIAEPKGEALAEIHYSWAPGERFPTIKQHSLAKHEILRSYLIAYMQTLTSSPRQDLFRLTLVDGFAGGGVYRHATTGNEVLGSPFVMLEAAKEAEFIINQTRQKKIHFDIKYFFVEADKPTAEVLRLQLVERGYGPLLENESIYILDGRFNEHADSVVQFIKKRSPKSAKAIFLLDQYGYTDVPVSLLNMLMHGLAGAEVILTFAVDSFINFAGDHPITKRGLERIGVSDLLHGRSFDEIKRTDKKWRLFIQSCLYRELVEASGASFYTPFFVRSTNGHGDYWLLHLSQRPRARDVMTRIHWEKNNYFIHYGGAGLNMFQMLGYVPEMDSSYTGQMELGFCFDNPAKDRSVMSLAQQIPHLIYPDPEGMTFGELFSVTCNSTPASAAIYREALGVLLKQNEVEIIGQDGTERRSASRIHDTDQILAPKQQSFVF